MNKDPVYRMYVDHYLQTAILSRLSDADRPLRFSELKEDGIENSLFMYHANKLITRRAITKDDDGFRLTPNGARWINSISRDMMRAQPIVKPLIQLVVRDSDGNILLSTRKGQLKELLNDYMLPGGLHKNGASADENATRIAQMLFGEEQLGPPQFLSLVESINVYSDGFIYHSLSHVYAVDMKSVPTIPQDDRFCFEWVPIVDIRADNPLFVRSLFVPAFLKKFQSDTLQSREVIKIEYSQ
jgi:ADP-ribose pyrophosphatase YjhB (NUDIX family)